MPSAASAADLDAQAKLIEKKINFADFKDPAKLGKFLSRFSALYDLSSAATTASSPALALIGVVSPGGTGRIVSIDPGLFVKR
jgi:hypothetical protein